MTTDTGCHALEIYEMHVEKKVLFVATFILFFEVSYHMVLLQKNPILAKTGTEENQQNTSRVINNRLQHRHRKYKADLKIFSKKTRRWQESIPKTPFNKTAYDILSLVS